MSQLIIFRTDNGQIVVASRVNKNHSSGNFPPKIRRLLAHAEELNLKHIFIDDHVDEHTHRVELSHTGYSVVRKEEADPRWLEPLLSLVGEIPKDPPRVVNPVRYVVPAGAAPEHIMLQPGITIFVPLTGRWFVADLLFTFLREVEFPDTIVNLILYDNSNDESFGSLCKWFLVGVNRYSSVQYIEDPVKSTSDSIETIDAVARVYRRMSYVVDTEFVLTVEDDVIPDKTALVKLWEEIKGGNIAAVSGNILDRQSEKTMAWYFRPDADSIQFAQEREIVQRVDAVSFSCTLFRTRAVKMCAIRERWKDMESIHATDITLMRELKEHEFEVKIAWDVTCTHFDKKQGLHPRRGKLSYVPSSRKSVSAKVHELIGLPKHPHTWITQLATILHSVPHSIGKMVVVYGNNPTRLFRKSFREAIFPKGTVVLAYGDNLRREDVLEGISVQFIDDWDICYELVSRASRVLFWNCEIVVHPEEVPRFLSSDEFIVADFTDVAFMKSRHGDFMGCKLVARKAESLLDLISLQSLLKEPKSVEVRASRWVRDRWIPEDSYLPAELEYSKREAVYYFGDPIPEPECELDLTIVMVCRNQLEMTREAISCLLATTYHIKREIIVWDNASDEPGMSEMLSEFEGISVYLSDENVGYIPPANYAARKMRGRYLVVANNDIIAYDGWYEEMVKEFADPQVGQVGVPQEYGYLNEEMHGGSGSGPPDYVEGFFFMLPRHVILKNDVFDSANLAFATCEDADLSLRLKERGYRIAIAPNARIKHLRSITRKNDPVIRQKMDHTEERNKKYMRSRWARWNETRKFPTHTILVKRKGANGDLLSCEPALKGLRWKFPFSHITLLTESTGIMENCPHVDLVTGEPDPSADYNLVFDLKDVYERDLSVPRVPLICADVRVPHTPPAYWIAKSAYEKVERWKGIDNLVVLHWWTGWLNKRFPRGKWMDIVDALKDKFHLVEVGWKEDERLGLGEGVYNLTWQETAALLTYAKCFVGVDSGVMHVALGVGTPTVGLFGPTKPELIFESPNLHPLSVEIECIGCHHNPPYPKEITLCHQPVIYCQQWLKPCNVAKKVFEVTGVPYEEDS